MPTWAISGRFRFAVAWFGVALPALTLNYFGQGGLLLADPSAIDNPFYQLAPSWAHYATCRAGDCRHRDCLPGSYLRRLFPDTASNSTRLSAAYEHRTYRGSRDWPDLRSIRKLGTCRCHARCCHRIRLLGRPSRRIWYSCFVVDGYHDADGDVRRAALEAQSLFSSMR